MRMALEHINVIDLTRLSPGPYCTWILADLGADVIKVEEPGPPTGRRAERASNTPPIPLAMETNSPYNAVNRNKRSIGLNLKHPDAREIFFTLVKTADVVVEEFRPGVTKRLGIDYETVARVNPGIVYCAITGYGQDGPYQNIIGHDINYIGTAGALGVIGEKGHKPTIPLNFLADLAGGGMNAAIGILAALMARERTGKGQFIDISMTDGVISLLASLLSEYYQTGEILERGATFSGGGAPQYNTYECQDGKYLCLGSREPWFFANLCRAIGCEDLIPYPWDKSKYEEIFKRFSKAFKTKPRDEWLKIMRQTDTCVAPVYLLDELERDPQIIHRKMIVEVEAPQSGKIKQVGISIKLSDTPGKIRRLGPKACEHTDEILKELGYQDGKISNLKKEGAIR